MRLTPKLNKALHIQYADTCQYCFNFCNEKGHVDHIVPIAKNGKNKLSNFTLSCKRCNKHKRDKLLPKQKIKKHVLIAYRNIEFIKKFLGQQGMKKLHISNLKIKAIRDFPNDLWHKARLAALKEKKTIGQWLAEVIERHLKGEPNESSNSQTKSKKG